MIKKAGTKLPFRIDQIIVEARRFYGGRTIAE
jgi:hypothetical protein